ncbi:MAG: CTP synthase (glutamine hydrolyzing) [Candidatus Iainarchaeum archaeon]|uniref:CTP synthase n=1 Tax=Candidatus Iainarchaeum sp. TaxID=3101447 RepID=A0A7T9DIR1_9ARCH|nr:MAG: CTP synthase (glutamine hydrolyzing) [Candidatus Diapherotrites archaeon]
MQPLIIPPAKTKFIVITGGVISGLGKGVAAAAIGKLLSSNGKIIPMKLDGYLNVDPGTMNPLEHGEVFVLDDKGEVDMDFGHYERFLGINCKSKWNLTMGKVFDFVRQKERRGDYLGKTVQFIPHVTNAIKEKIFEVANEEDADIMMIEVGGTVGDLENELYIEAVRQLKNAVGEKNIAYIHMTYVPIPGNVKEQKSKPTQQSVNLLRQRGIQPDIIIGRCAQLLDDSIKERISIFCDVPKEAVITGLDVDNVYRIPLVFRDEGILTILNRKLQLLAPEKMEQWEYLVHQMDHAEKEITLAICGKYTKLEDSYASVIEAIRHASAHLGVKTKVKWIETTEIENGNVSPAHALEGIDAMIVPGGFGSRGIEGKIRAIQYAREHGIPYLGLCYGMQLATIEYARSMCNMPNANTTEVNPVTPYPIIDLLPEQNGITEKGATMRLGGHDVLVKAGTHAEKMFGPLTRLRFRHRYEVNPTFISELEKKGLVFSGKAPEREIMQIMELPTEKHPFFMGTQAHPELSSRLEQPSPFFVELIRSASHRKK